MLDFFAAHRPHTGMRFSEYLEAFQGAIAAGDPRSHTPMRVGETDHHVLNLRRSERIARTFVPEERSVIAVRRIAIPQLWMVLSEFSCGDSAQSLPIIAHLAALNPLIDLRVLLRDQNLDIMERYLTNGTRSIPKLVAFSASGSELFRWGPRPEPARRIFAEGRAEGLPKEEILERVHAFYGRDRGKSIEHEVVDLLSSD